MAQTNKRKARTNMRASCRALGLLGTMMVAALVGGILNADAAAKETMTINGAGATFPMPIYAKWASAYEKNGGAKIEYRGIGSGGGIAQIKAKAVDFGASDEPLAPEELDRHGLIQFPLVIGGVVPVHNIQGINKGQLKLTPELLTDIFLGKIKKWSDPRLKAVNPGLKLPDADITICHRADGSGTTWIFTTYLSKVSLEWKQKVGADKAVSWPQGVGGKGNPGVTELVKKVSGSLGYVEFAYALENNLNYVLLQNRSGEFVAPTIKSFQAACENASWEKAPGFYVDLNDQPGQASWPITGSSFILVHKNQLEAGKALEMLKFFDWCFRKGASIASDLHYVPIPSKVYGLVESMWKTSVTANGAQVWKGELHMTAKPARVSSGETEN
ncbi:MAG: phosphate ABC transporter substrate-binding protein PstS [Desulfomonile sp.]|nr:phosphate ABC transporter substrate-binding protein PstS [Desulfomonile sp.]